MAFNKSYPENQTVRKAWNLYSNLYGAEADIEPHGNAYLTEYKAIGDRVHRASVDAMKAFGEFSVGHHAAVYLANRHAEHEYHVAMDRYFNAVYELETA